jgi:hypothetical protein
MYAETEAQHKKDDQSISIKSANRHLQKNRLFELAIPQARWLTPPFMEKEAT